jgi:prephenate dehydrogenase
MKNIGLIGFGRFGQLMYQHLHHKISFQIYDKNLRLSEFPKDFPFESLQQVCKNSIIILAVPISQIERTTLEISTYLQPGTLIIDVCSVKKIPLEILAKNLPQEIEILGSHPLFGPDSAANSLDGHRIVLCPVRVNQERLEKIRQFLQELRLQIIDMTPDEHDYLMAWTLALTHFLGRGLSNLPLPNHQITTMDYQNLLQLMKKVNRDTRELFEDMHCYNPYTAEMRDQLIRTLADLNEEFKNRT